VTSARDLLHLSRARSNGLLPSAGSEVCCFLSGLLSYLFIWRFYPLQSCSLVRSLSPTSAAAQKTQVLLLFHFPYKPMPDRCARAIHYNLKYLSSAVTFISRRTESLVDCVPSGQTPVAAGWWGRSAYSCAFFIRWKCHRCSLCRWKG
jgi:hypothetical protein